MMSFIFFNTVCQKIRQGLQNIKQKSVLKTIENSQCYRKILLIVKSSFMNFNNIFDLILLWPVFDVCKYIKIVIYATYILDTYSYCSVFEKKKKPENCIFVVLVTN